MVPFFHTRVHFFGKLFILSSFLLATIPADAGIFFRAAQTAMIKKSIQAKAVKKAIPTAPLVGKPHDVIISRSRYPQSARHIDHAQRQGQPSVLHIDRSGATGRRSASTGSINRHRKPGRHYDRDEYPPAFVREGGHNANVRHIHRSDNRGAGAAMGAQTRNLPDGSKIRIVIGN